MSEATVAIGIDIGGTKIAGGLVDQTGHVLVRKQIATQASRGGQAVLEDTLALAHALIAAAMLAGQTVPVAGIGISICELVDPTGQITSDQTIQWVGLPIQAHFAPIAPTIIEADVRAHALAEATFGAGRALGDFVFLSIGTGISSCLVQNGQPYAGVRGNALIVASMPITVFDADNRKLEFTLEPFASGAGMVERFNRLRNSNIQRVEEIVATAQSGDSGAMAILQTGGEALGSALGWLVNVLDPAAIVVGGGLGLAEGVYWESLVTAARRHIYAAEARQLPILKARCGAEAGIIGAATRAISQAAADYGRGY